MASNVLKSVLYVQVCSLKRDILPLLLVVVIHFLVLRFAIKSPDLASREYGGRGGRPKCESLWLRQDPDYCSYTIRKRDIFPETRKRHGGGGVRWFYNGTKSLDSNLNSWKNCCKGDSCVYTDYYGSQKAPTAKKLVVYPGGYNSVQTMFDNARKKWPYSIFRHLRYVKELKDDSYRTSNIVIIVNEFSKKNFVYTIRNNVFSGRYQKDCSGSYKVVDTNLTLQVPGSPSQSSEEFVAIQTAINEAYSEYLGLKPADWEICTSPSKDPKKVAYSNFLEKKMDHLNLWLYISVSALLLKLISDVINSTSIVKILTFQKMNPACVHIIIALKYAILSAMVSVPFFNNKRFGYEYMFPCFEVKMTAFAVFTFYVSSISFATLAASFFSRKSTGLCTFFVIWVSTHFVTKWIMEYAPNNITLLLVSMLPAGGLYESLTAILSFEVINAHHSSLFSALFSWPRTPVKMLPLGLIWFMMWFGAFIYIKLLNCIKPAAFNGYRSNTSYFGIINSMIVHINKLRFIQRFTMPNSTLNMESDQTKKLITDSTKCADVQTCVDANNSSCPKESTLQEEYSVPENKITIILGGRLSGKSSLLFTFAENPFSGRILLHRDSLPPYEDNERHYVGLSTHQCALEQNLTTHEHLIFSALLKGFNPREANHASNKIVNDMDLNSIKYTKIKNLDALQEFKASVSVALVGNPKVLVLDELTSKLDLSERTVAWDLLLKLRKTHTILMSTTSSEEADYIGDYVGIVDEGNLLSFGNIPHLRKVYNEHYTIRFIPKASRSLDAIESLRNLTQKVSREGRNIVVACEKDESISKIMEVVEGYLDSLESKIETTLPLLVNIYSKAIGYDLHESSAVVTSYFKEEDAATKHASWWNKIKAHYIRMLWHNKNSLKLILAICVTVGVIANPRVNECFSRNNGLPKVPIQTSYLDEPSYELIMSAYHSQKDNEWPVTAVPSLQSNNFYSLPLAINQIYNALLSYADSSITTYHQPFVTIPSVCWQESDKSQYNDLEGFVSYTYKSSDTCYFYVMKLVKYLFVSSSVIMAVIHQTERTTGQLKIHYLSGSNVYIYWGAAFLAGVTITSAIYLLIIIKIILIFPSNELLSNPDIHWNLLVLFLYGVSCVNSNNFLSLFFNQKSNVIGACTLVACIPLIIGTWNFLVLCFEIPKIMSIHIEWVRIEESVLRRFYDPLMAPPISSSFRNLYCSICKDEWLDLYELLANGVLSGWTEKTEKLSAITLLIATILYFLIIIAKEKKWLSRRFLCALNPIDEQPTMKGEWKQVEFDGKRGFNLVISGALGKQLPDGSRSRTSVTVKRGSCLGLLRKKDASVSKFMNAIMVMPNNKIANHFFKINGDVKTLSSSMGYCNGKCGLHNDMTGRQQLSFLVRIRGLQSPNVNTVVNIWLGIMGLSEIADLRSREYDVNSRKKLGIALALIGAPFLAVLEEPTAGVDFRTRQTILSVINHCNKEKNQSIIVVTQDPSECEAVCDQVVILHDNSIKFNSDITTLKNSLCKEYVLLTKFDPSASEHEVCGVKRSLFREFPDLKYTTRRGVWRYFVLPRSQINLSSIIGQTEKFKAKHPIVHEMYVNVAGADHVLAEFDTYCEETVTTV